MNVNSISYLNQAQMEGSLGAKDGARDSMKNAMREQKNQVNATYKQRMKKVADEEKARNKSSFGRLFGSILGTVLGGPIVGTFIGALIGDGIAGLASKGNKKDANRAGELAGMHDIKYGRATDRFDEAKKNLEGASEHANDVAKFSDELRDMGWTGLN